MARTGWVACHWYCNALERYAMLRSSCLSTDEWWDGLWQLPWPHAAEWHASLWSFYPTTAHMSSLPVYVHAMDPPKSTYNNRGSTASSTCHVKCTEDKWSGLQYEPKAFQSVLTDQAYIKDILLIISPTPLQIIIANVVSIDSTLFGVNPYLSQRMMSKVKVITCWRDA